MSWSLQRASCGGLDGTTRTPSISTHFSHYFDLPSWDFDIVDFDEDDRPVVDRSRTIRAWLGDARAEDLLGFLEDIGVPRGSNDEAGLRLLLDRTAGTEVIHGPRGWMPELEPSELLGLRIERGEVCAIALDRRQVAGAHVDAAAKRIAGLAHLVIGPDASWFGPPSMPVETLLAMVATEAPELLRRPLPPIRDVIRRGGLVLEHGAVRHPGTREPRYLD